MKLKIGTRGSRLALVQTNWVVEKITKSRPDIEVRIEVIKTKGDIIVDKPIADIGDKGLFVKEIEDAILDGRIDLSVNSMKDMPAVLPDGLRLSHIPLREDAKDALVTKHEVGSLKDLPRGAVIATGSKRRSAQLKTARPDIKVADIRGNIETRIKKIETQNLDGIILAMAGLNRLNYHSDNYTVLPLPEDVMLPAPCQGILAVEIREDDDDLHTILECLRDETASLQAELERSFLYHIEGGCHAPTGAYALIDGDEVKLTGLFGTDKKYVKKQIVGRIGQHQDMGELLAEQIKKELQDE